MIFLKVFLSGFSINNGRYKVRRFKDIIEFLTKRRNIKNYKSKLSNRLYKIFQKQSKNEKRIDDIKDELKDLTYNISRSESKEIKKNLYNIEKRNKIG